MAKECKHELKYCRCCDTVICTKCGKKWGEKEYINIPTKEDKSYPYIPPTIFPDKGSTGGTPDYRPPQIWCIVKHMESEHPFFNHDPIKLGIRK